MKSHVITYILAGALLIAAGNSFWQKAKEEHEEKKLATIAPTGPKDLNINAVERIRSRLEGRSRFSFVVLGDSQRRNKTFQKVLGTALEHDPDFIIHTGDLTTGGRYHQYQELLEAVADCPVPIVFAVGNHDISHSGEELFFIIFGPPNFFFDAGGCRFIFVNNNGKKGAEDLKQLPVNGREYELTNGFTDYTLEKITSLMEEQHSVFMVMHIPPPVEPFMFHSFQKNKEAFLRLMADNAGAIKRVFSGHIHGYGETVYKGVSCVVTGGAGGELHTGHEGITGKYNYVLVNINGDRVTHTVHFVE